MNVRYHVKLTRDERAELRLLLQGGPLAARKFKRAQILLAADAGMSDDDIATSVGIGASTVYRTRRRFIEGNLTAALSEEPRRGRNASSRRKRRRCWWPPPVQALRQAVRAGRWSFWPTRWSD